MTEQEFLKNYNPEDYEKPSVTVDALVFCMEKSLKNLKILLIKRNNYPYKDAWALPGGFVGMQESAYEAACRELEEETGLTGIYLEQLYTMSKPDRDPRMRVIDIAYIALAKEMPVIAGDDAKEALWFDIRHTKDRLVLYNEECNVRICYSLQERIFKNGIVPIKNYVPVPQGTERLAFDHADILLEGLMQLRKDIEVSDVAFNLLPPCFTLSDLQRVYEVILGKELYKKNFRDRMLPRLMITEEKARSIVGGRLSALYHHKDLDLSMEEEGKPMKRKVLVVIDMQKDFTTGVLGNAECAAAVSKAGDCITEGYDRIIFTRDTHKEGYLDTQEGKKLPVPHCIRDSEGWQIVPSLMEKAQKLYGQEPGKLLIIDKPTFGSTELGRQMQMFCNDGTDTEIMFVGVCTGICVLSNVTLVKAFCPEAEISVIADACACVTPESHATALEAMKLLQVSII